jgi:DNA modification methylase
MSSSVTLLRGECLEEMGKLAANSVDAILTDPPFVVPTQHYASRSQTSGFRRKWSDISPLVGWFDIVAGQFARILKPTGHVLVFCNADSYPAFYPAIFSRFDVADCLVWDKRKIGMGIGWRKRTEFIVMGRYRESWFSSTTHSTVIESPVVPSAERMHPAQKPSEMLAQIAAHVTPHGGVVLDPFMGSGSTGVGVVSRGLDFIGIEQEADYVEMARNRIAEAQADKPQLAMAV